MINVKRQKLTAKKKTINDNLSMSGISFTVSVYHNRYTINDIRETLNDNSNIANRYALNDMR